jgi:hypothetical protein
MEWKAQSGLNQMEASASSLISNLCRPAEFENQPQLCTAGE